MMAWGVFLSHLAKGLAGKEATTRKTRHDTPPLTYEGPRGDLKCIGTFLLGGGRVPDNTSKRRAKELACASGSISIVRVSNKLEMYIE
jgi:hypothetical protein